MKNLFSAFLLLLISCSTNTPKTPSQELTISANEFSGSWSLCKSGNDTIETCYNVCSKFVFTTNYTGKFIPPSNIPINFQYKIKNNTIIFNVKDSENESFFFKEHVFHYGKTLRHGIEYMGLTPVKRNFTYYLAKSAEK
ncbi:hypothetical protein [Xanthocytophaga agilis]|uniref:Uncharacterized protein n=1 Tax=Xanthocytophaga agilis TaxID=3048010 RepID=A0AAE3R5K3_9BACT|nr:hypothetical protein [Xanthocytophaga agilis]MDJ1501804.1 hypothetical protein [Xanthocytophaga agilis]